MLERDGSAAAAYFDALAPLPPALADIRRHSATQRKADMSLDTTAMRLLVWLSQLIGAKHYLEIGVYTGFSSTAVALALPEDGHVTACDINLTYTDAARLHWQRAGVAHKITLHLQPALITLRRLAASGSLNTFDLALIDADKLPTQHYYEAVLPLMRVGGVIAVDNVLLGGRVCHQAPNSAAAVSALQDFHRHLAADTRVQVLNLPYGDGLTLMRKRAPTS